MSVSLFEKVNTSSFYGGYTTNNLPNKNLSTLPTWKSGEWFCGDIKDGITQYDTVQGPFVNYDQTAKVIRKKITTDKQKYSDGSTKMFACVYVPEQ